MPSRHAAIAQTLREEIATGNLAPGTQLPSEARLTERFGVSRGTVRQAIAALRTEGLVAGGRGRAPIVRGPELLQSFDQLMSFSAWVRQLGRVPSARTLELTRRPARPEESAELGLDPSTPVFRLKRLRLLDGEPVMVEHTTFTEPLGRLLLDCDLDGGSIYAQLAQRGVAFAEAEQTIAAAAASLEDADLLGIPRRSPVLAVRRRATDAEGTPLELARDVYRADACQITIHNGAALPRSGVALRSTSQAA